MDQDSLFNNRKSQIDGYFQSSYFGLIGIEYEGEDLVVKNKQASLAALKATQKLLFGSNLDESKIAELGDNRSTILGFLQSSKQAINNNTFIFQGYAPGKELMIQYFNEKINEKIAIITSSDFTHTQLSRLSKKVENLKKKLLETKDENKKPKILDDIKEQNNATLDILFDEYTKNYKKIPKEILTDQHNLSQEKEAQKELTREEFERVLKEEYIPERNEFKGNFESNIALNSIKKYYENIAQLQASNPEISSLDSNVSIVNQASTQREISSPDSNVSILNQTSKQIENSITEFSKILSQDLIPQQIREEFQSKLIEIFTQFKDLSLLLKSYLEIESANSVLNPSNSPDNSAPQNQIIGNGSIGSNNNQSEAIQENKPSSTQEVPPNRLTLPTQISSTVSRSSSNAPTTRPPRPQSLKSELILSRANSVVGVPATSSLTGLTSNNITQSESGLKRKRTEENPTPPAGIPRQPLSATGSKIAYYIAPDKNGNSAAARHQKRREGLKPAYNPVSAPPKKKSRAR